MSSSQTSRPARVRKTPLPLISGLYARMSPGDFLDGYAVQSPLSPREAADIGLSMPGWAEKLLWLRNRLVAPLGLKHEASAEGEGAIFPVESETEQELILGTNDRHLDFRISVMQDSGQVHMGTWVHCNNGFGRAYLAAVMPFHKLILRDSMARIARHSR